MATVVAWLVFLVVFGPVILGVGRVLWAASVLAVNVGRPDDERPMTAEELEALDAEAAARRRALRDMEREQESWT